MTSLKCYNKRNLEEFINSGEYESYNFLPITKHRAFSQIKNPNADENDILLTLAFENSTLAGYLGTFPDVLFNGEKAVKYAWLSTLYVSENFRGKKIAQQLLEKVFESYNNKIAITEFTKEAESLYAKTKKFDYIAPKKGKRFYFRTSFATVIPHRKPKLSRIKPALIVSDSIFDLAVSFQTQFKKNEKVNFQISEKIDVESEHFLLDFPKNRSVENLRWILENPWILESEKIEKNYLFSSYSKQFKYFWVKIFDAENSLKTCALLQLRNQNLKIPYLFDQKNLDGFVSFLEKFIKDKKVKTLISYQNELNDKMISKGITKLYQKNSERRYLFQKELLAEFPENFNPNYQDGDGDPVFT